MPYTPPANGDASIRPSLVPRRANHASVSGYCAEVVNDIHAKLNATQVRAVVDIRSVGDAREVIRDAAPNDVICIAGGRHAMGGQQFAEGGTLLDTRAFDRIISLDTERGLVEVESGIQWPALMRGLAALQAESPRRWTIRQKQTGADRLSIGGALSANVHGRGLTMCPIVADIDSFTLIDAEGHVRRCSRTENAELFGLAVGGYGLFGFIASVTLRLVQRRRLERVVELVTSDRLLRAFEQRIAAGSLYGDFQFAIDTESPDFLHRGILSSYRPVDERRAGVGGDLALSSGQWRQLLFLAHVDKSRAFDLYAAHYMATSGQEYWSDEHQLSLYLDDYHADVDSRLVTHGYEAPGTEMITELFVPIERLEQFLSTIRDDLREHTVDLVYGTVRLIERDDESFLPWARCRSACLILNIHTPHTPEGLADSARTFRRLIDHAAAIGGSYYLTYHRYARADQVLACHPKLPAMLAKKRSYDPRERFQNEWYRCYRDLLAG
ncbi:MAG: FAD-binding oxidoreductase [Gemmatimonadaceae bacterium]